MVVQRHTTRKSNYVEERNKESPAAQADEVAPPLPRLHREQRHAKARR